jgi:hypothetical protein
VNPTELKAEERLIWANQVSFDMARRVIKAIEENYGVKGKAKEEKWPSPEPQLLVW